jgi:penicillin-binding protein 1A
MGVRYFAICTTVFTAALIAVGIHYVNFDRTALPDVEPFARFEFPAIGTVYDANGQPLIELAREHRRLTKYKGIPRIVRDAIIAAEDKNFFSHSGVNYYGIPRVLAKVRFGTLVARFIGMGPQDDNMSPVIFPQGGSTITQQLVRGYFLKNLTAQENSSQLRHGGLLARVFSYEIGPRSVNMLFRKLEEIRLSLWIEEEMQNRFGSKRNAKEEILARYASIIYMGNSQYGFATAAEYYFGRSLATFTTDDADKAALLAGIAKSPLYYAPSAKDTERVLRRRNQTLALMAANGFISRDSVDSAEQRPIQVVARRKGKRLQAPAVLENVLQELKDRRGARSIEDVMQGRIQVYSTVDARVQQIANQTLERGLELYEQRHPGAKGLIQGDRTESGVSSTRSAPPHTASQRRP